MDFDLFDEDRPIPHKLIGWVNYFLLKCWDKNHDVMLPFKHWEKCPILSILNYF